MRRHGRCCHVVRLRNTLPAAVRDGTQEDERTRKRLRAEKHGNGPNYLVKRDWSNMLLSMRLEMACIFSPLSQRENLGLFTRHKAVEMPS